MKEIKRPHSAQKTLRVTWLVLADLSLINLSAFLALYIRFEFDLGQLRATAFLHDMLVYAGINTVCTIVIFRILNLYNSLWEFASVPELLRIAMGCLLSSVTYMVGMFMLQLAMPRSFPVMYMLILCLLCGSLRFAYRGVRRTRAGLRSRGEKRTMLLGGGQAGDGWHSKGCSFRGWIKWRQGPDMYGIWAVMGRPRAGHARPLQGGGVFVGQLGQGSARSRA